MNQARIEALSLVNWRNIFYGRFAFHEAVTALEGRNGAGKTTVMIGAYVVLVPMMRHLRFTNLSEHDTRTGDRGIWGRLGHEAWPSFSALDIRFGRDERVIAGVRLERKTEPSVEIEPFLIRGLPAKARLSEILLDGRSEDGRRVDRLLDKKTLGQRVLRAGAKVDWYTVQQYYQELFDLGVLPLRLSNEEDQRRFNEMLRTSMIGGISRAMSGGLKDFVLRADPTLAQSLRLMQENLAQCQATRRQLDEIGRADEEIRGVYEAGLRMFHAAVHASRQRAEEQRRKLDEVTKAAQAAAEAHERALRRVADAQGAAERAQQDLDQAGAALLGAEEQVRRVGRALELAGIETDQEKKFRDATTAHDRADAALRDAEFALEAARTEQARARERLQELTANLADASKAFQELSRRAGLHREARTMLELVRTQRPHALPDLQPETLRRSALALTAGVLTEIEQATTRVGEFEGRLLDTREHARTWAERHEAFERVVAAASRRGVRVPDAELYERASLVLAALPGWREQVSHAPEIEREALRAARQVASWRNVRELAARLLGEASPDSASVRLALDAARDERSRIEDDLTETRRRRQETQARAETCAERMRGLEDELPRWQATQQQATSLRARSGLDLRDATELDRAEGAWLERRSSLSRQEDEARTQATAARAEAALLESAGSGVDPRLQRAGEWVEGELVASRYDEIPIEDAARVEAALGPLRDALIVQDTEDAARRLVGLSDRPDHVVLLTRAPPEKPPGILLEDSLLVGSSSELRVSRLPERPILGRAARARRIEELRQEAEDRDKRELELHREILEIDGIVAQARALRAESARWLGADPAPLLSLARREFEQIGEDLARGRQSCEDLEKCKGEAFSREKSLVGLSAEAWLLDDPELPARAKRLGEDLLRAQALEAMLSEVDSALAILSKGIEALRRPPLDLAGIARIETELVTLRSGRAALGRLRDALSYLAEHPEAPGWTEAEVQHAEAASSLQGLESEQKRASEVEKQACSQVDEAERVRSTALGTQALADAHAQQCLRGLEQTRLDLETLGIGRPGMADLERARREALIARTHRDHRARACTDAARELGRAESEATRDELRLRQAETEVGDAEKAERPARESWVVFREEAQRRSLLASALTDAVYATLGAQKSLALSQIVGDARTQLVERLRRATDTGPLVEQLGSAAGLDGLRWQVHLESWSLVREWLCRRVPQNVTESDDPVRILQDMSGALTRLRENLERLERQLQGSAGNIANHIHTSVRTARSLVDGLNRSLQQVRFGSIERVKIHSERIEKMNRLLDILSGQDTQLLLFASSSSFTEALASVYEREFGGHIAGDRLLDYREYLDLKVSVMRATATDWETASATRMSTGEAIGVGAALMMVVLDAWERKEMLGRNRRRDRSLRFLFLDEANRLSQDSLATLFDLCQSLGMQLLIAAPEVEQAEGNITHHLERLVEADGERLRVTSRKLSS